MDTMEIPRDIFGSAELTFSPTKRLGQQRNPPVPAAGCPLEGRVGVHVDQVIRR
jgi:hypothetical protein